MISFINPQALFDQDIFELLGVSDASRMQKEIWLDKSVKTIQNKICMLISDRLSEPLSHRWKQLLSTQNEQEIEKFLKENSVDVSTLAIQAAAIYRTEMLVLIGARMHAAL